MYKTSTNWKTRRSSAGLPHTKGQLTHQMGKHERGKSTVTAVQQSSNAEVQAPIQLSEGQQSVTSTWETEAGGQL